MVRAWEGEASSKDGEADGEDEAEAGGRDGA